MSKQLSTKLSSDAPVVGVPLCVKQLEGQNFHTVGEKYLRAAIEGSGAYPLSFPALGEVIAHDALLDRVDGVLFTGSLSNVAVHHYGGLPDREESPQDPGRDAITLPLIRAALARGVPIFCICRGFQELNVALGGTLFTQLHTVPGRMDHRGPKGAGYDDTYGPRHTVALDPAGQFARLLGKNEIMVNSLHWQGIDRLADGLAVEGRAPDGTIEAVRVRDARDFALGVQWHPEYKVTENPDSLAMFRAFGVAMRSYAQRRQARIAAPEASAAE